MKLNFGKRRTLAQIREPLSGLASPQPLFPPTRYLSRKVKSLERPKPQSQISITGISQPGPHAAFDELAGQFPSLSELEIESALEDCGGDVAGAGKILPERRKEHEV